MSRSPRALQLRLAGEPVATLVHRTGTPTESSYELLFEPAFIHRQARPVLTLAAQEWKLETARKSKRLFPFLENLLPESQGALRRRLARAGGFQEDDEFALLEFVGQDLAGAITLHRVAPPDEPARTIQHAVPESPKLQDERLRMSGGLAGVQLKFSVDRTARISLPMSGQNGRWILKMPDGVHPHLVRAELAAMSWARLCGFEVPQLDVVDPREVEGLPRDAIIGDEALLIRRFDRTDDFRPVHMEELCSVLQVPPDNKYQEGPQPKTLRDLALVIKRFAGRDGLLTFFDRILFDVLVGNGDAHLKNWAFLFPDRRQAVFAPAYDIVPTVVYEVYAPKLSLIFLKEQGRIVEQFHEIDSRRIRQFAREVGEEPDELLTRARRLCGRARETFDAATAEAQLPTAMRDSLKRHWESLPLMDELGY